MPANQGDTEKIQELEASLEECRLTITSLKKELEEERTRVKELTKELNKERRQKLETVLGQGPGIPLGIPLLVPGGRPRYPLQRSRDSKE
jgi:predicted RNase H-like nuclease (RuvC/YqgF family)